jgi:signal transduction histidine kinase
MHDVLAHRLSLLATYAGAMEYRPDASPEQLSRAAAVIRAGAHQALDDLRQVITLLRDDDLEQDSGSVERPQPGLADLPRLVDESRAAGTRVQFRDDLTDPGAVPPATGRTVYRVVQEGLTNARKHAAGRPVDVVIDGGPGGRLMVDITNPVAESGNGSPTAPGTGTGLIGLSERVGRSGGELNLETTAAGELHLHAWLPWPT